ncbi:substrate-binding periplasmic protein [Emcibacter nanhaiensis]|uniref:Amino acid ABC transporter substrate-binding protein n=1 Tax=Emcibacter nanhaiensis TaxID=1505037 RepID=A0A501PA79_9PROT|nr:transporter substrate-binding domain-containing protein [Emcibacter nanhaiensis]TPD57279.1 amino acid ABC transporter substrate-binding protein [Emcibacter nanhaiensis]
MDRVLFYRGVKRLFIIFFLGVPFCLPSASFSQVPNTPEAGKIKICGNFNIGFLSTLAPTLVTIYKHIGYQVELTSQPSLRCLKLTNEGLFDAEAFRTHKVEDIYPNLIKVPAPIGKITFAAYALDKSVKVENPDDLKKLRIGFVRGIQTLQSHTEGMNVTPANDPKQLVTLLTHHRVDVILMALSNARIVMSGNPEYQNIMSVNNQYLEYQMYHYVHKRHSDLIPLLNQTILELQGNGTITFHEY